MAHPKPDIKKPRKGAVKYKFKPRINAIAASNKAVVTLNLSREIAKDTLKGMDYEDIAVKRGMDVTEVRNLAKQAYEKWGGDLGQTAIEARTMDLKRMDAMLERLHPLIYPEPELDGTTGLMTIPKTDFAAMKLALDIFDRRAKLLGTEAAHKLETDKMEFLRREYAGVKLNAQGAIDL